MNVLSLNLAPCYHISLPCIMGFDNKINHQRIQTTRSHVSCCHHCSYCHYCDVDFVLFRNVTCYTNSMLSHIHINTTLFLNTTCTLVATSVVLWSLESTPSQQTQKIDQPKYCDKSYLHFKNVKNVLGDTTCLLQPNPLKVDGS